jgi:hypothetical protein
MKDVYHKTYSILLAISTVETRSVCLLFNNPLNWQLDAMMVIVKMSVMRWWNEDDEVKQK